MTAARPAQPNVHRGRSSTNSKGTIWGGQGLALWRRRRRCQAEVLGAVAALGDVAEAVDFEEFFQVEYRGLVRALYLLTGDQGEAEELAQATMARVYERWDRVRVMESPAGTASACGTWPSGHAGCLPWLSMPSLPSPPGRELGWSSPTRSPRSRPGSGRRSCSSSGWG